MNCLPAPREIGSCSNDSNIGWPLAISLPKNLSRNTLRELFSCWVIYEGALFISRIRSLTYLCMLYCLVFLTTLSIILLSMFDCHRNSLCYLDLKESRGECKESNYSGLLKCGWMVCSCSKNLTELASFMQRFSNVAAATLVIIPLPLYICTVMSYKVWYCFGIFSTDIQKCRKTLQIYYILKLTSNLYSTVIV